MKLLIGLFNSNTGRTVRVQIQNQRKVSEFLTNAVQAAFDWVSYESAGYVRLSVIPNSKFAQLDLMW